MTRTFTLIAVTLLLGACTSTGVRMEHDPDVDFSHYRSFAWMAPARSEVDDPILDSEFMDRKVREAVAFALVDRGFDSVSPREADFLVTYHTDTREKVESSGISVGVGYHHGRPRGPFSSYGFEFGDDVRSRPEGTLIIDIVDRAEGRLIWRGWRATRLDQERFDRAHVTEQVRLILADFPPGG